jgi:phosphoribosylformylglycinamidine synthase subunit PurL
VRTNTLAGPERADAAIVRVKGSGRSLAITSDVNPVYCYLDPYEGGKQAVVEAARNVACAGARPMAITDCLNFGSPEKPEIMHQFAECIRGMTAACIAMDAPVVSGNVSFYNDTEGVSIYPTPTVGMVGLIEDESYWCPSGFREEGDAIILFGDTKDELGGSEYARMRHAGRLAQPPRVDLARERALVDLLLDLHAGRLLSSAHDLSGGGFAVALAECAMQGIGCVADLTGHADDLDAASLLFGESQGRVIASVRGGDVPRVLEMAARRGVPAIRIGTTGGGIVAVRRHGVELVEASVASLRRIWRDAFAAQLAGDSVDDILAGRAHEEDIIV